MQLCCSSTQNQNLICKRNCQTKRKPHSVCYQNEKKCHWCFYSHKRHFILKLLSLKQDFMMICTNHVPIFAWKQKSLKYSRKEITSQWKKSSTNQSKKSSNQSTKSKLQHKLQITKVWVGLKHFPERGFHSPNIWVIVIRRQLKQNKNPEISSNTSGSRSWSLSSSSPSYHNNNI